jgi:hypothetical protein
LCGLRGSSTRGITASSYRWHDGPHAIDSGQRGAVRSSVVADSDSIGRREALKALEDAALE